MNLKDIMGDMTNLRNGDCLGGLAFRQLDLAGNQIDEEFSAAELEARLNEVKQHNGSAVFQHKCPHLNTENACSVEWHPFSVTINGNEYIDWFWVTKMDSVGAVWIDMNDFSGSGNQRRSGDVTSEGSASADGDPILSESEYIN